MRRIATCESPTRPKRPALSRRPNDRQSPAYRLGCAGSESRENGLPGRRMTAFRAPRRTGAAWRCAEPGSFTDSAGLAQAPTNLPPLRAAWLSWALTAMTLLA